MNQWIAAQLNARLQVCNGRNAFNFRPASEKEFFFVIWYLMHVLNEEIPTAAH